MGPMQGETKERWLKLCEEAAGAQDPARLFRLVNEINNLPIRQDESFPRGCLTG